MFLCVPDKGGMSYVFAGFIGTIIFLVIVGLCCIAIRPVLYAFVVHILILKYAGVVYKIISIRLQIITVTSHIHLILSCDDTYEYQAG